jgi:nucleoside-diphosphate-sugar epimerase
MTNNQMKVFVVGSTGTFAKPIIQALLSSNDSFETSILVREETLDSNDNDKKQIIDRYRKQGAKLISGDVLKDSINELAEKMKGNDVIVSVVGSGDALKEGQLKLIAAAKKSGVNWFIPSEFGMSNADYGRGNAFGFDAKLDVQEELKRSGLDWTIISTGLATEFITKSGSSIIVDMKNRVVEAPGSFDNKITTTCLKDVAGLLVQVLKHPDDEVKNKYLYMGADTLTIEQVAQTIESHFNTKFERKILNEHNSKDSKIKSAFFEVYGKQKGVWWDLKETWNAEHVPDYHCLTFAEFLKQSFPDKQIGNSS